jgi:putative ABC transport system permease protein
MLAMFSKIAINNVKRSFKDYSIYFLTLTFAVCIFYSFNSIESQKSLLDINTSTEEYMIMLNKLIAGASIFVSFILGGLIVYANNFLIKKRKKELGIYMTLGMSKRKISRILILETFFIGLLSLVVGILLGIIVSQGLSVITAKLLSVNMNNYKFIISISSIAKSSLYFGVIFILVMIFNQVTISKYKLIDMLNAAKKNEEVKINNPIISIIMFILSLASLISAYTLIMKIGLSVDDYRFMLSIVLGIIGTILWFFSLSSFLIQIIQKNKNIYFKKLNIFVLRQINNKITTNFISMTTICLMLFLTITLLFSMFSYKNTFDKSLKGNTYFDSSAKLYVDTDVQEINDMEELLNSINFNFDSSEKYVFFNQYKLDIYLSELLNDYLTKKEIDEMKFSYSDHTIPAVKVSEYNSINKLLDKDSIDLKDNEILIVSNYDEFNKAFHKFIKNENSVVIDNNTYIIKNGSTVKDNISSVARELKFIYFIIPDNFEGKLTLEQSNVNVIYDKSNYAKSEEKFSKFYVNILENRNPDGSTALVLGNTLEQLYSLVYGSSAMVVFLGIYLGVVFLISSAAVLALQQLSEASDSISRYNSLKKIGVTEKMINKSILKQTLIYFMAPLSLAIIHSIIGMKVVNEVFATYNKNLFSNSSIIIALALTIIYGGYFYTTYISFKNIVRNSK